MSKNLPQRQAGRPRNTKVDALAAELGVTPRRVRQMQQTGELPGKAEAPGANAPTLASARLRRALAEAERCEIALANERLESRRISGELIFCDDGIKMILAALETTTQALRNGAHRYGQRANPENPECGRRAVEAFVAEVGQLAQGAIHRVAESGKTV